jgi:hypothetical protein
VEAGVACCPERSDRARPQFAVLGDQRPVEVAGERVDVPREAVGEADQLPATEET